MKNKKYQFLKVILGALFLAASLVLPAAAQEDPNPDSPTPILLSEIDSTRALALNAKAWRGILPTPKQAGKAFIPGPNSRVVLFVTNLDLMPGEGANAFRVFIEDAKGTQYGFRVNSLSEAGKNLWALEITLYDDIGYWGQPEANGDVLLRLIWRGLTSNRVRLGLGKIGGDIKDDEGAQPTPFAQAPTLPEFFPAPSESSKKDFGGPNAVGYRYSGDRMRFLEQTTFGPTPELDNRIRRIGIRTWLAEQFEAPYPTFPYPNVPLKPGTPPADCNGDTSTPDVPVTCFRDTYSQYLPQVWFFQEAFYGEAQLKHRVSWALSQLWVTSGVDIQQSSHMISYHKVLTKHAFGNWRNLMKEMTLHPTMGEYLDMARSTRTNPNENFAREILQLFNVGLFMLNQDGTLQGGANPIPSYDQNTVNNFTKVFTGWSFCNTGGNPACPNAVVQTVNYIDPMWLNTGAGHDITAKTLLDYPGVVNRNIPACTGCTGAALLTYANNSMDQALDNIFLHPNLPPFVSKYLIQHLVTSDPSPAYVQRVANVFANNGSGVRGDLKATIRAILLDPEARGNIKTDPSYGKLREPVLYTTNFMRQFGVGSADGTTISDGDVNRFPAALGQNVFRSPTVFNYYPPDYYIPGTTVLGPEYAILTTSTAIQRSNFVNTMVYSRINGGSVNTPLGTSLNFADMQALATADPSGNQLMDALNTKLMHGNMPAQMRSTILTAVTAIASTNPLARAQAAIYLTITSSQYQVQR